MGNDSHAARNLVCVHLRSPPALPPKLRSGLHLSSVKLYLVSVYASGAREYLLQLLLKIAVACLSQEMGGMADWVVSPLGCGSLLLQLSLDLP